VADWTCRRQTSGLVCGNVNDGRKRKCGACGKPRPPRRKPSHLRALELSYEDFLRANGGLERCGICGSPPKGRKLDRDHEHRGDGRARGLLCWNCNKKLDNRVTPEWLRRAADYLERFEEAA
jgi:hypothetical protein